MAQFLADIAGMLEIFAIAAGLILLHKVSKEKAKLLTAAGLILVVGGIGSGLCTGWYWLEYQRAGEFDSATSGHMTQMSTPHMMQQATPDEPNSGEP